MGGLPLRGIYMDKEQMERLDALEGRCEGLVLALSTMSPVCRRAPSMAVTPSEVFS